MPLRSWFLVLLFVPAALSAAENPAKPAYQYHYQTGKVTVGSNLATIDLPEGYRYLQTAEARHVVEKEWNNPPDESTLGVVLPPGRDIDGDFAAIISFEETGYVKDDDAKSQDYAGLLKQMQEGMHESNPARKKQGYPTMELNGWAEPPTYDSATKKFFWAKSLQVEGSAVPVLNYDIRVLGRRGVLEIGAIGALPQLADIAACGKEIMGRTEFTTGNRYADFSEGSGDKIAAYGLAGLVAGGVLAKAGFLKLLWLGALKLIKPLIFVAVVIGGVIAKMFGRGKKA
ncbi:MAG: DUF2167 domain-containing protein [Planctomycetes bacterium]|nr:DUF2167 domain-containing protein [Planctomycetota bacterium]